MTDEENDDEEISITIDGEMTYMFRKQDLPAIREFLNLYEAVNEAPDLEEYPVEPTHPYFNFSVH